MKIWVNFHHHKTICAERLHLEASFYIGLIHFLLPLGYDLLLIAIQWLKHETIEQKLPKSLFIFFAAKYLKCNEGKSLTQMNSYALDTLGKVEEKFFNFFFLAFCFLLIALVRSSRSFLPIATLKKTIILIQWYSYNVDLLQIMT